CECSRPFRYLPFRWDVIPSGRERCGMNLSEIKFRLITIAEKRKRPYFDMIVVREVYEAFKNNTYHELKNYVLAEMEVSVLNMVELGK
ncbi:hypothetical protein, partial [Acinetobacter baumannii]|uniref:hypothetical protein n=2 Tax=Acinetobacter baumannii TaxID=470 RepID=UPI001D17EC2E